MLRLLCMREMKNPRWVRARAMPEALPRVPERETAEHLSLRQSRRSTISAPPTLYEEMKNPRWVREYDKFLHIFQMPLDFRRTAEYYINRKSCGGRIYVLQKLR